MTASALVLFARAPVPGRTKSRLALGWGGPQAAAMAAAMLEHAALAGAGSGYGRRWLACAGDAGHPWLVALGARLGWRRVWQQGDDLGARMHHALTHALAGADSAVLYGADAPGVSVPYLERARTVLATGNDAVLGPARDGGYVLIGLRRPAPGLFSGIPWGTAAVAAATRRRLRALGLRWQELPVLDDVDLPGDVVHLRGLWRGVRAGRAPAGVPAAAVHAPGRR